MEVRQHHFLRKEGLKMYHCETADTKRQRVSVDALLGFVLLVVVTGAATLCAAFAFRVGKADNFTDIFYTNSFRGAFEWFKKLDWVGMIVQCVISCFSLFGVALLVIRIMTSMLYLSAKGMWEEVHDLKSAGGESEMFDFGLVNMAKSWAKGKAGTGLDAIIGAVLILLPDVKKYSDFGEKSGAKFEEDTSITQYILKIALPTVMTVFFFAMGFNGTLFQALAVTVDFMGSVADRAISVNYSGFVDDLINSGTGYQFVFSSAGTQEGDLKQNIAKDIYGRVVAQVKDANAAQLYDMGKTVETKLSDDALNQMIEASSQISVKVKNGLSDESLRDSYMGYLGYDIVVNGSESATGAFSIPMTDFQPAGTVTVDAERAQYMHVFLKQTSDFNGSYFNLNNGEGGNTSTSTTGGGTLDGVE